MAGKTTPYLTYSDTVTKKVAIADYISMIGPWKVPLLSYLGMNASPSKFNLRDWPSTDYRWFEDAPLGLTTGLQASVASNATTFAVTASDGYKIRPSAVLQLDSELVYVTAITTDTVTVTRAYGGTTAATHGSSITVYRRYRSSLEAETNTQSGATIPSQNTNYTQVFRDVVTVSGSEKVMSRYGIPNKVTHEMGKKQKELLREVELALFYGKRTAGSATTPRGFGGMDTFITTNTSSLSGAITENAIENALADCWSYTGEAPNLLVCGQWVRRRISSLYRDMIRKNEVTHVDGLVVDKIDTHFGTVDILMDPYCPTTSVYLLNTNEMGILPYRDFFVEKMAIVGDKEDWQLVGEYGYVCRQDLLHAIITDVSTTS